MPFAIVIEESSVAGCSVGQMNGVKGVWVNGENPVFIPDSVVKELAKKIRPVENVSNEPVDHNAVHQKISTLTKKQDDFSTGDSNFMTSIFKKVADKSLKKFSPAQATAINNIFDRYCQGCEKVDLDIVPKNDSIKNAVKKVLDDNPFEGDTDDF
jgi:hypothetical protein